MAPPLSPVATSACCQVCHYYFPERSGVENVKILKAKQRHQVVAFETAASFTLNTPEFACGLQWSVQPNLDTSATFCGLYEEASSHPNVEARCQPCYIYYIYINMYLDIEEFS